MGDVIDEEEEVEAEEEELLAHKAYSEKGGTMRYMLCTFRRFSREQDSFGGMHIRGWCSM